VGYRILKIDAITGKQSSIPDGQNGQVLSTSGNGELSWITGGSGANTSLSNLISPTSVNQNITFGSALSSSIISTPDSIAQANSLTIKAGDTTNTNNEPITGGDIFITAGADNSGNFGSGGRSGNVTISSGQAANGANSGFIIFNTYDAGGNATGGMYLNSYDIGLNPNSFKMLAPQGLSVNTRSLSLSSLNGSISVSQNGTVNIDSGASNFTLNAGSNIRLHAPAGNIRLDVASLATAAVGNVWTLANAAGDGSWTALPPQVGFANPMTTGGDIMYQNGGSVSGPLVAISPGFVITQGANPQGIAISPDGASVYVTNASANFISLYSRNLSTGSLSLLGASPVGTDFNPTGICVSPDGTSVYVANYSSVSISQYSRNISTGDLAALSPSSVPSGNNPNGIVISPDGLFVYATSTGDNSIVIYSRNSSTGLLSYAGAGFFTTDVGVSPWVIKVTADNLFLYVINQTGNTISMYSRNVSTGDLTSLGTPIATGVTPFDFVISPDGLFLYVTNLSENTVSIFNRNISTGQLSFYATAATGTTPTGIVVTPDGGFIYVLNNSDNTISMYSRDANTGSITLLTSPTVAAGSAPHVVTITADGSSVYVANNGDATVSMYYRNIQSSPTRLPNGNNGQILSSNGGTAAPSWKSSTVDNMAITFITADHVCDGSERVIMNPLDNTTPALNVTLPSAASFPNKIIHFISRSIIGSVFNVTPVMWVGTNITWNFSQMGSVISDGTNWYVYTAY
jgi:6-phosphogluconolactonase